MWHYSGCFLNAINSMDAVASPSSLQNSASVLILTRCSRESSYIHWKQSSIEQENLHLGGKIHTAEQYIFFFILHIVCLESLACLWMASHLTTLNWLAEVALCYLGETILRESKQFSSHIKSSLWVAARKLFWMTCSYSFDKRQVENYKDFNPIHSYLEVNLIEFRLYKTLLCFSE